MDVYAKSFIQTIKNTTSLTPHITHTAIHTGYCSKISTQETHFYFCFDHAFLLSISSAMLFDDNPTKDDLYDLSKEIANLVIGHAKVLLAEQGVHIQINTPSFLGEITLSNPDLKGIHFAIEEGKFSMYKESLC